MAIWQVDFYAIPKENAGCSVDSDEIYEWRKRRIRQINVDFLEKTDSWSENMELYGENDATCMEFDFKNSVLDSWFCRLDLTTLDKDLLEKIIRYIDDNDAVILYEDQIYSTDIENVLSIIKSSAAARFCSNPQKFFEDLKENSKDY